MPGVPDPLYVRARAGLLDAVEALGLHRESVVLVGAQAIYLHTGDADLAVAEYTTDADFTMSPRELTDAPLLGDLLGAGGFTPREDPGGWLSPDGIYIDLMVPEALAGPGRRGAAFGPHGRRAARRAKGLEGALVDRDRRTITSLDATDARTATIWVAGPSALLVAKIHKIGKRVGAQDRRAEQGRSRRSASPTSRRNRGHGGSPSHVGSVVFIGRCDSGGSRASYQHCSANRIAKEC